MKFKVFGCILFIALILMLIISCTGENNKKVNEGISMQNNVNNLISVRKFTSSSSYSLLFAVTEESRLLRVVVSEPGISFIDLEDNLDMHKANIIEGISDVHALSHISCSFFTAFYFYIIKADGSLWRYTEELYNDSHTLERIESVESFKMVYRGREHSIALTVGGAVFSWGNNDYGQLGDGTNHSRQSLQRVYGLPIIVDIAAGSDFCIALGKSGEVFTWGSNFKGELGDGSYTYTSASFDEYGNSVRNIVKNNNRNTPFQIELLSDVTQVAAGDSLGVALRNDGSVYMWGTSNIPQPSHAITTPQKVEIPEKVVQVAAASLNAFALTDMGNVWEWGWIRLIPGTGMDIPVRLSEFQRIKRVFPGHIDTFLSLDGDVWQGRFDSQTEFRNGRAVRLLTEIEIRSISNNKYG